MGDYKTYIGNGQGTILAGGANITSIWLTANYTRDFNLCRIIWQLRIYNNTDTQEVPIEQNTDIAALLSIAQIGATAIEPLGYDFFPGAVPNPSVVDRSITLFKAGEYNFNEVKFRNGLYVRNTFGNLSLVNSYTMSWCVILTLLEL